LHGARHALPLEMVEPETISFLVQLDVLVLWLLQARTEVRFFFSSDQPKSSWI
jgi:hypothetical protein